MDYIPHLLLAIAFCTSGILVRRRWVRILLWLLSLGPFVIGLIGLIAGGLGPEPLTRELMPLAVAMMIPLIGCLIGEVVIFRKVILAWIRDI